MTEQQLINTGSLVTLHFTLTLTDGSVADSTKMYNKPAQFRIGDGSMSAGFEACLLGLAKGASRRFSLPPEQAFGLSNPDLVQHLDANRFGAELPEEGTIMAFAQPDGTELPGVVRSVIADSVTVDFNHPLVEQTIIFDVEIIDVEA